MIYKFRGLFNREKEYEIETNEPLYLYDTFALSIKKFDPKDKSYNYDNIDCILRYSKKGTLDIHKLELDGSNLDGFYSLVETFKKRECLTMGEAIELIVEKPKDEFENVTLDNAEDELRLAFNEFMEETGLNEAMFKLFLKGVSYGKKKNSLL